MKKILPIIISAILASLIWIFSSSITGFQEPWDAGNFYYITALFLTGALSELLNNDALWKYYLGAVWGQFIYMLFISGEDAMILLGLLFLLGYSLLFLLGASLGKWIRIKTNKTAGN